MRRIYRCCALFLIMSMLLAIPVMAQEVTDPTKVIKAETFNAGEEALQQEFKNSEVWRSDGYLKYLDGVIYNLNETVRVKQEVVTNYKYLSQYNSYYATLIPKAEYDLMEAKSWVDYYKLYKNVTQADFEVRYPR